MRMVAPNLPDRPFPLVREKNLYHNLVANEDTLTELPANFCQKAVRRPAGRQARG